MSEQTARGLRRALESRGFEIAELWLEGSYPLHRIFGDGRLKKWLIPLFRRHRWLKQLLASQIYARARKVEPGLRSRSSRGYSRRHSRGTDVVT